MLESQKSFTNSSPYRSVVVWEEHFSKYKDEASYRTYTRAIWRALGYLESLYDRHEWESGDSEYLLNVIDSYLLKLTDADKQIFALQS